MKVYRVDSTFFSGVFTEEDLNQLDSNWWQEDELFEIDFTIKELEVARSLYSDTEWCLDYEEEYGIQPSVYDILKEETR